MRKIFYKALYILLIFVLIILTGIHILDWWMEFSDDDIESFFRDKKVEVQIIHHKYLDRGVRVVKSGYSENFSIIGIHGAPGGWDAYKSYMIDSLLLNQAEIISYDRPGYGPFDDGPMTSLEKQAEVLKDIIKFYASSDNIILLSHSFGGPIAAYYNARSNDHKVIHLMVAPAIDPDSEKYFWVSPLGYWTMTKWLMPENYITASYEKYTHEAELKKLEPLIDSVQNQTIHLHGMKDWLAPARGNIEFVKNRFSPSLTNQIILEDAGHLLIWDEKELLTYQILQIIKK